MDLFAMERNEARVRTLDDSSKILDLPYTILKIAISLEFRRAEL